MKRMTDAYSHLQSLEDVGTIEEVEMIDHGKTDVSHVDFRIQFIRDRAFRLELHSENKKGVGPYSLIYYWDGNTWSLFDSINLYYGSNPVKTNADWADITGSGAAVSYDLMPSTPCLLCVTDHFCGFRGLNEEVFAINGIPQTKLAKVTVVRLGTRHVYRLTLTRDVAIYHDIDEYWIDPQTYTIIKQRSRDSQRREERTDITALETIHSPRRNSLSHDAVIAFNPPHFRPDFKQDSIK